MSNEAARARQDWRVQQDPAFLLRTDKADQRLDSLSRAEFNDLLDAALATARRSTVEQCKPYMTHNGTCEQTWLGGRSICTCGLVAFLAAEAARP